MSVEPHMQNFLCAGLEGMRTIALSENGSTWITFTLSASQPITDALGDWQSQANAHPSLSGAYLFSYVASGNYVFFGRSNQQSFHLSLSGDPSAPESSLALCFGFSSSTMSGSASYASDLVPMGISNALHISYTAPRPIEEVDLTRYRHGRALAWTHAHASMVELEIVLTAATATTVCRGPLFTSLARVATSASPSQHYGLGQLGGWIDVYPFSVESIDALGPSDRDAVVKVLCTVWEG